MQKIIFAFIAAASIISCNPKQGQPQPVKAADSTAVDSAAVINDPKNNLAVQANSFIEIDTSGVLMFPLALRAWDRGYAGSGYNSNSTGSYWNIIFYNTKTGGHHLLSERKMLISSYDTKYNSSDAGGVAYTAKYIFYQVITDDFNSDKKLEGDDPLYLFVSDKEGNNFRQVSPPGYNMRSWQFIKSTGKVLITATKDSDNNKKFDENDELVVFSADMNSAAPATEIFPQEFKNKLKLLYDKDWKELKK
jgi:hypothetical protein